jgi:hypothetical protein
MFILVNLYLYLTHLNFYLFSFIISILKFIFDHIILIFYLLAHLIII